MLALPPIRPPSRAILLDLRRDGAIRAIEGRPVVCDLSMGLPTTSTTEGELALHHDPATGRTLARPGRFGTRPLYFAPHRDGVVLGTSSLACLHHLKRDGEPLDPDRALRALAGEGSAQPTTFFRGVFCVPPGFELSVTAAAVSWALEDIPHDDELEPAMGGDLAALLSSAIERRLDSSGTWIPLSGGLDSSLLVALSVHLAAPLRALSLDDGEEDELNAALGVASMTGVAHEYVSVSDDEMVEAFPHAVMASESLLWNARAVAKYVFWRKVRARGWTRVLSGVGADEVFWGNPRGWERTAEGSPIEQRLAGDQAWAARLRPHGSPSSEPCSSAPWDRAATRRFLLRSSLPWSTMPPECTAAAALGLDVRLPYLDIEVLRYAWGLGWGELVAGHRGKLPLRSVARDRLPARMADAPKTPVISACGEAAGPRRQRWAAEYERWIRAEEWRGTGWDLGEAERWLALYASAPTSDPDLPRADRMLMRLASLAILLRAARSAT